MVEKCTCMYIQTHIPVFQTHTRNFCIAKSKIKLIFSISIFEPTFVLCCKFFWLIRFTHCLSFKLRLFIQTKPEQQILEGQILSLHFWKDVNQLERVWRKATGMRRGLENITHEKRLKVPRLFSLERNRQRGKKLIVFKYLKSCYTYLFSKLMADKARRNDLKLW